LTALPAGIYTLCGWAEGPVTSKRLARQAQPKSKLLSIKKKGILVSGGGVRSIWQRHNLETFKKRLKALEEKAAKEGIDACQL
jgi:hypothetical protein